MKSLFIVALLCLGVWFWQYQHSMLTLPPQHLAFTDVSGETHQLSASPSSPYVIVPWIDNCPYSARTLTAIEQIVSNNSAPNTYVYGFYINPKSNQALSKHPKVKDSLLAQSAAQEDINVIKYLDTHLFRKSGFMPGDVYVVNTQGGVEHVATRKLEGSEVLPRILEAIQF